MPFTKKGIPGEESDWVSGELQTRVQFRTCSEIEMLVDTRCIQKRGWVEMSKWVSLALKVMALHLLGGALGIVWKPV